MFQKVSSPPKWHRLAASKNLALDGKVQHAGWTSTPRPSTSALVDFNLLCFDFGSVIIYTLNSYSRVVYIDMVYYLSITLKEASYGVEPTVDCLNPTTLPALGRGELSIKSSRLGA